MASITAADVTYATVSTRREGYGRIKRIIRLTFPNGNTGGNNQYVAGGIPLSVPGLGFRQSIHSVTVLGRTPAAAARNPVYEWDAGQTAPHLLAFEAEAAPGVDKPLTEQDVDIAYADNSQVVFVEVRGH